MTTIIASIADEHNWAIARAEGLWGYRQGNVNAVKNAMTLGEGDHILFYRGTRSAKDSGLSHGFVALGRITESPQRPWPPSFPVPWEDADYEVRIPFELIETYDPPIRPDLDAIGISSFGLLSALLDDAQVSAAVGGPPPPHPVSPPKVSPGLSPKAGIGVPYTQAVPTAKSPGKPFTHDPEKIERGEKGHADTQNALAAFLENVGIEPREPDLAAGEPPFDVAWESNDAIYIAEVKSITKGNRQRQMRLGLGQLLWYRKVMESKGKKVVAVLAPELEPTLATWKELCDELGIVLVWPGNFDVLASRMGLGATS